MVMQTALVELVLAGFFAVACLRSCAPINTEDKLRFGNLFRLPGRLERLRRSRWQWVSMVALLLVIRLQEGVPLVFELTVALQFMAFLALPARTEATRGALS
jgi:hypothetical protein